MKKENITENGIPQHLVDFMDALVPLTPSISA
jgi:hypothetical protein